MDEPTQPAEPKTEAKRSRGFAGYVVWGFGIVAIYFLSSGPVLRLTISDKLSPQLREKLWIVYWPMDRLYFQTPFYKPIGLYWHLWCPVLINEQGDPASQHFIRRPPS